MYNKALRLQSCGELLAAEDILQTLIEDNIPQLELQGGLPKTMSTMKYSCYTNLGCIAIKKQDLDNALEYYLIVRRCSLCKYKEMVLMKVFRHLN